MLRARTHVDPMGKWIEFGLHIHGLARLSIATRLGRMPIRVSGRIVNTYIYMVDKKTTDAPA